MTPTARIFKDEIIQKIKDNPKTSWGKNELMHYILELYTEFLERYIE